MSNNTEPITEEWLKSVGFRWHQFDRQPEKQWLLWLGGTFEEPEPELLGIEVSPACTRDGRWHCWLRSDLAGRYSRFVHVRYVRTRADLQNLVAALSGQPWNPEHHIYGGVQRPETVKRWKAEEDRLDRQLRRARKPWADCEIDETRGGALPEHLEAHIQARKT